MASFLVLDTNYFLHFRSIDDVDWRGKVGDDDARLVITAVCVRELERKKVSDPRPAMRQRAASVISRLLELAEADEQLTRSGVPVDFLMVEPTRILDMYPLDKGIYDDVLIAHAIGLKEELVGSRVLVVSDDSGVLLKCRHFGLTAWRPESGMRLSESLDDDQRELKRLKEENLRLRSAQPKLRLALAGGKSVVLARSGGSGKRLNPRSLDRLKIEVPLLSAGSASRMGVSEAEIQEYNGALEVYYSRYSAFLRQDQSYREWLDHKVVVGLEVFNDGTAPADDLDIEVQFVGDVVPVAQEQAPKKPQAPMPPRKPRGRTWRRAVGTNYSSLISGLPSYQPLSATDRLIQSMRQEVPNVRGPWMSAGDEPVVTWHIRRLKHLEQVRLVPVTLLRRSLELRGAKIEYRLHAANLPDPVEGEFSFGFQAPKEAEDDSSLEGFS